MTEKIDHPSHYGGADNPYEAIKVIEAWSLNFALGSAVKYIARHGRKAGEDAVDDLKKAAWYCERESARLEAEQKPKTTKAGDDTQVYPGGDKLKGFSTTVLITKRPKPKILVVGKAQSGKSSFASYLAKALGTKAHDTSEWLIMVETARQNTLRDRYDAPIVGPEFWDNERGRPARKLLVALGDAVCTINPGFLVDRCWDQGRICVGVRRKIEFDSVLAAHPQTWVFYVGRSDQPEVPEDNFELDPGYIGNACGSRYIFVRNFSSLKVLQQIAKELASRITTVEAASGESDSGTHG